MSTLMSTDLNITRPTSKVSRPPGGTTSITFGDPSSTTPAPTPSKPPKTVVQATVKTPTPVEGKVGIVVAGSVEPETLSNAIVKALALEGVSTPVISFVGEISVLPYGAQALAKSVQVVIAATFVTSDPTGAVTQSLTGSLLQVGVSGSVPIIPGIVTQSSLLEAKALLPDLASGWAKAAVGSLSIKAGIESSPAPEPELPVVLEHSPDVTDVDHLVEIFSQSLKDHGASGIIGLGRKFKIADDNSSGTLDIAEFTKVVKEHAFDWSPAQIKLLFEKFDKDGGGITYDEFLVTLRGELNERRRQLVLLAFEILDKDKSGVVTIEDIKSSYNAKKHPDVIAGKRTENEILAEFLDTFEVGGTKDGKVTPSEFIAYYGNVSSSIDLDDYFELMIRNAWHISGGEGWCANSSCRRVLVTHADGHQSVQEIKNDLGISETDKAAMLANLKAQGLDDIVSIETKGSSDSPSEPPASETQPATPVKDTVAGVKARDGNIFRSSSGSTQFNRGRHPGGVSTFTLG
eukprot:gene14278-19155_t